MLKKNYHLVEKKSEKSQRELRLIINEWRNWFWQMQRVTQRNRTEEMWAEKEK